MKYLLFPSLIIILILHSCQSPKTWKAYPEPKDGQAGIEEVFGLVKDFKKTHRNKNVEIILEPGNYYLTKPLIIDPVMSQTTVRAKNDGEVWIKGSKKMEARWSMEGDLLVADLPIKSPVDQVFIDGKAQIMARYPDYNEKGGHWQGHAPDVIDPERLKVWKNPVGAFVHVMHSGEWGGFHYTITGLDQNGEAILLGGHQNNRPSSMHPRYRMVENVFEELDSPGEWYFDSGKGKLYWYPVELPPDMKSIIEIPILKELIEIKGNQEDVVKNVKIRGIGFTHSIRTFMEEYEPLLRSDWKIYRGGTLLAEGSEGLEVSDCEFKDLGGNGIFLSGYNKTAKILRNHIHDIGATAISVIGHASAVRSPSFQYSQYVNVNDIDTVSGPKTEEYPAGCHIDNNLIYRIGRIEKQVAGVQLSMCMDILVSHNSIYDVPRAGINISEGTWGGHIIEYNDVFKTVQESGDHGSFNSWGRDRFWHPNRKTMDSLTSANPKMPLWDAMHTSIIRNNRFRCDHGWDIDLDDGSTNYKIYNNLCLNGGLKLREGFYRQVENNIIINNGFHPHVWFSNSEDIFRNNILMTDHKDIRLAAWGKEVDYNFFPNKKALEKARENGTDLNSDAGNPDFIDPQIGDFRVSGNSPALKIGFKNFNMNDFGVQTKKLKALREEPEIPALFITEFQKENKIEREWLGAIIKNIEGISERSATGLPDENGVLVLSVKSNTPASKAGIIKGDVIIGCEGLLVKNIQDLLTVHQGKNWMGELNIKVFRNQSEQIFSIKTK